MRADLLHGDEHKVWGDGGHQGQGAVIREAAPHAQHMISRRTRYKDYANELQRAKNRIKAWVRAKVEDPGRIVRRILGFEKTRFCGLKKNHQRLCLNFVLAALYLHRRQLALSGALVSPQAAKTAACRRIWLLHLGNFRPFRPPSLLVSVQPGFRSLAQSFPSVQLMD
jgi:hypothetical protein